MLVSFTFLTQPGVFAVDVPDNLVHETQTCVIKANGYGRSVVLSDTYPDGTGFDRPKPTYVLVNRLHDRRGAEVDLLNSILQPPRWGLVWRVQDRFLSTWGDPEVEDAGAVAALVGGLSVASNNIGGAKLDAGTSAALGDIRQPDQRDTVTVFADPDTTGIENLAFSYAGGLARGRTIDLGEKVAINVATSFGIEIGTTVLPKNAAEAEAILKTAGGSLRQTQ